MKPYQINKIGLPYKRELSRGGFIISRNTHPGIDEKYKVTSWSEFGSGCIGYSSTYYFSTLKESRKFLSALASLKVANLSTSNIKQLTA